jgi:2-iminobutanoate/2-iminopropanoate deaminase
MPSITRTLGQSSLLPGSTIANGFIFTSGIVAPAVMAAIGTDADIPFDEQVRAAVDHMLAVLAESGAGPAEVMRVEAFLASSDDMAAWNDEFVRVWPVPGPARTTTITGFTSPIIRFEIQAIAAL